MGMPVRRLMSEMDARELDHWAAFEELYGIPDGFFVVGQICTAIGRYFAGDKKASPSAFVPYYSASAPDRVPSPSENRAKWEAFRLAREARKAQR